MANDRVVDFDLANERVVISTILKSPEARSRVRRQLNADDFGHPPHQVLFRATMALGQAGLTFSEDTIADLARGHDFGGYAYLRAVLADYEPTRNIDYHVARVRADAVKFRLLGETLPAIAAACEDPEAPPEKVASLLTHAAQQAGQGVPRSNLSGDSLVEGYYQTLRYRSAVGGVVEGTGFSVLDSSLIAGLGPRAMSIIVARPAHGKTTMVANILRNRLLAGRPTWCGAWEMEPEDYLDKIVAIQTNIPAALLLREPGRLSGQERDDVIDIVERFRDERIIEFQKNPFVDLPRSKDRFFDYNDRNMDIFEAEVERASGAGKAVFFLDVVGKMLPDRRPDPLTYATVRLRSIAKRYAVHICLVHHLSRDGAEGRPTLETIKGSGAFEEEADLVLGLDRPILRASPAKRAKTEDYLDVHVLKQRNGPAPLCVRFRFQGGIFTLSDEQPIDLTMLEREDSGSDRNFG
jgi:replicative DNA helicase